MMVLNLVLLNQMAARLVPESPPSGDRCLGEFSLCPGSGECSLGPCGQCAAGEYRCPMSVACISSAAAYKSCPGLNGTHLDWTLGEEERLDYLVAHTTVKQQAAQMTNTAPALDHLGIPAYQYLNDDQHGVGRTDGMMPGPVARTAPKATILPNGCGLGATWSVRTLSAAGAVLGTEARGLHNGFVHAPGGHDGPAAQSCNGCGITLYSPNLNLVRDPRWGRAQETFGEDPYHMSRLVAAYVTGAQNGTAGVKHRPGERMLVGMCCKHFAVYNVENNRYTFNATIDRRNLWESYLPGFKACVSEARSASVMCSYNQVNGVPTCAEPGLLTTILREQWGFEGFVVSDYDAWVFMAIRSTTPPFAPSVPAAAVLGLNAGLDQEGGGNGCVQTLPAAVANKTIAAEQVAKAFRRLFRVRLRLGMLDPPATLAYNEIPSSVAASSAHLSIARTAARESICLYKNDVVDASGRQKTSPPARALPLAIDATSGHKKWTLLLAGAQGDSAAALLGNYAESASVGGWGSDILTELRKKSLSLTRNASGSPAAEVLYAPGCDAVECNNTRQFSTAVAAAKTADAVVVILGLHYSAAGNATQCDHDEPWITDEACEGEGQDRQSIELPGNQTALVAALAAAKRKGVPLIGLLVHGGALALGSAAEQLDAVLDAWYPGMEGAAAIADVLFGDYNPAGRTAVTWYNSTAALPTSIAQMDLYAGDGLTYRFYRRPDRILYHFGHGLSYTRFEYSKFALNATVIGPCDVVGVRVRVKNAGSRDGDEVVQVYARQPMASVRVPQLRLSAFDRVFVSAGRTVTVNLPVKPESHSVVLDNHDEDGGDIYFGMNAVVVEAGRFQLFIGGGQPGTTAPTLGPADVTISTTATVASCGL